jgi:hypothetical protein
MPTKELLEWEEEDFSSKYVISVNGETGTQFPVPSCPVKPVSRRTMRVHFRNVHNKDTLIVEEEGPLPRCERCGLFQREVGLKHQQSADCVLWTAIRKKRADDKVNKKAVRDTVFYVQGVPIENVKELKYLGRVVNNKDDDQPTVMENLRKARMKWGRISRIFCQRMGPTPKQWHRSIKLLCNPCSFMAQNHGCLPYQWKSNCSVFTAAVPNTLWAST